MITTQPELDRTQGKIPRPALVDSLGACVHTALRKFRKLRRPVKPRAVDVIAYFDGPEPSRADRSSAMPILVFCRSSRGVAFPDYVGTAQLDRRLTGDSAFKVAGIDEDKWMVVGFDIGGGERNHLLHVVAVDLEVVPEGEGSVFDRLMTAHGHIPTRDLLLHDVDPYELLKNMSHHFELRLRTRNIVGKTIMVTSLGDIPEQL